ncbi:energy transducer TonB [Mucilaginibacter ginsenosidivorans]|uniref:Energy transducer TonB n=1 Tax=Mucilaginibacter ginsenosidivorans TaxID=398053 RepID=A0A5B8US09_9SPHI|nr:energy transducer TonB [Mucilaginibacter ginsenosidivorans]QEC61515.1 energy transducer TonB [Mucilaginibacter ginsenosidivorans]
MRIILIAFLIMITGFCSAQVKMNVYFLKNDGRYVSTRDSADYIRAVTEPDSGSTLYNVAEFYLNNKRKALGKSSTIDPPHFEGLKLEFFKSGIKKRVLNYRNMTVVDDEFQFFPSGKPYLVLKHQATSDRESRAFEDYLIEACYDSTGVALATDGSGTFKLYDDTAFKTVIETGSLKNGRRDGVCTGVDDKGKSHFEEKYENGMLISGTFSNEKGEVNTYTIARSIAPAYPGGLNVFYKYLSKKIRYPDYEREHNVQGTILMSFTVEKDGKVTGIKLINTVSPNIDAEALRVMKASPPWVPGIRYGRPVRVRYQIPIGFSLSD